MHIDGSDRKKEKYYGSPVREHEENQSEGRKLIFSQRNDQVKIEE